MKDFLTVKEFAEMANKKPQTIYKQLDKRLKPYVKIDKGQKVISAEALKDFYGVEQPFQPNSTDNQPKPTDIQPDSTDIQPDSTADEQPDSTAEDSPSAHPEGKIEALNRLIDIIQKQLEEKDKQLAVKDKQIADLSDRLAEALQLTKGQQYIAAADKKKLLEIEQRQQKSEQDIVTADQAQSVIAPAAVAADQEQGQGKQAAGKQKLRVLFRRFFN